jgi:hypothetical protein
MNISLIEKDLWEAADDLRANSKLTATEYAQPILGIIFLSHATSRFYSLKNCCKIIKWQVIRNLLMKTKCQRSI